MTTRADSTPLSSGPFALAIDIGGTKVESALVDPSATLLPGSRHRAPTGSGSTADDIADAVRRVIAETLASAPPGAEIVGAGIGSAGPIDAGHGTVSPLNLSAWRAYPVRALVRDAIGTRVPDPVLRLDGLCILLAEHWAGALQHHRTAMGMVISTGIGGGLLVEGRLVGGRTGNAGHIGQIQLHEHESAGKDLSTTLEGVASGTSIVAWAREQGWGGTDGPQLSAAYAAGDPIALAAVERCANAVGDGIASACALLDLEAVAIGGGFVNVAPDLIDRIRARVNAVAPLDTIPGVEILRSALSDEAPLIGAAGLVHRADLLT
ncbi:ROK family protein [Herbiconiux sp. CPCC 203407]|uniref:ROK family protein n=1 Tax=Herbiconiux oxytropis TaxID=2970915 RepID=A0AA42BVP6_9MICO|nr:ROK family protein [Herbiconiux oxytropis]MCS5723357.1 ROK family protein [Herbiconiux oxytropis]MCS5727536.1 ROK family protein [Herbiconiux oxytropis]